MHIWNNYLERAEDVRHSSIGKETYGKRGETVERVFADAKEKYAMRYTPYRGLSHVTKWVKLKYTAMNLKKLAIWRWRDGLSPLFTHCLGVFNLFVSLIYSKNPVAA